MRISRITVFLVLSIVFASARISYAAEGTETERLLRTMTPPVGVVREAPATKGEFFFDSFYEQSRILQGTRIGWWSELTNMVGYIYDNCRAYISVSQYERFDDKDYTANIGGYISFKNSYLHYEEAFGWHTNYIWKFQSTAEYGHKAYENLWWQLGYQYRGYPTGDTHIVYPDLLYYFGDSYIGVGYGASWIESRDCAQFGNVKGNFAITDFLKWWVGCAFGERLYDIYGLKAAKEQGYILFTGFTLKIYKDINCRVGYIYGEEKPKFIKRSLNFAIAGKF